MRFHGGMWGMIHAPDEKPKITRQLLKRVLHYAQPYRWLISSILLLILAHTGLMLLTPLILRDLIDNTIPAGDVNRLMLLAVALLLTPALDGVINVAQRRVNSRDTISWSRKSRPSGRQMERRFVSCC